MSDYIKRKDAIKALEGWKISGEMILGTVPPADVVEVVRCKDCRYRSKTWYEDKRRKDGGYWIIGCNNDNIAERVYGLAHDDDFCSFGERKDT